MNVNSQVISRSKQMMGTTIKIDVVRGAKLTTVEALDLIEAGFGEFDRIVKQYTRFNQHSELSNLNRRGGEWTEVTPEFFSLINQMLDLAQATDGAFDPTIIDFLETYGYDPNYDFSKLDNPDLDSSISKLTETRPSWKEIEVDASQTKVKLAPNQRLDLGGIGKGYAIDCAAQKLLAAENFLINAGGDIYAQGVNLAGEKWRVELGHKSIQSDSTANWNPAAQIIGAIELQNQALACSGSWARKVKQFHHLINPATGKPADTFTTIYTVAASATIADAWATSLFVGGLELAARMTPDLGLEFMLINQQDQVQMSEGFARFYQKNQ